MRKGVVIYQLSDSSTRLAVGEAWVTPCCTVMGGTPSRVPRCLFERRVFVRFLSGRDGLGRCLFPDTAGTQVWEDCCSPLLFAYDDALVQGCGIVRQIGAFRRLRMRDARDEK